MQAVILAAGRGSRLRPLTDDRPKCMVELGGIPLLHRQLAALRSLGVRDITIVGGYRADAIRAPGVSLITNSRHDVTNMVATLLCAEEVLRRGGEVVVSYGDIVCEPRIIKPVLESRAPLNVAVDMQWRAYWELRFPNPLDDAETLRIRDDGTIADIGRRPRSFDEVQAQYLGLMKVTAEAATWIIEMFYRLRQMDARHADRMFMTDLLQALIDDGRPVNAVRVHHGWLEVDSQTDLMLYDRAKSGGLYDDSFLAEALPAAWLED
jgi:L-glutamine-phosphate cytidylyltransferase